MRLILASASPRRRELLAQAGYEFEVRPADVNEDPLAGEDPIAYVTRLAREKAEAAFAAVVSDQWSVVSDLVVLGADTTVVVDGEMLAKPLDAADARRMLRILSGRTHRVITGVAVVASSSQFAVRNSQLDAFKRNDRTTRAEEDADPSTPSPSLRSGSVAQDDNLLIDDKLTIEVAAEVTAVKFLTVSDAEIDAYIATGEPMDKAGAYAIQGRAAKWIPRIEGCYFNVVGLPLALVGTMLKGIE